jgi:hypothetical protein
MCALVLLVVGCAGESPEVAFCSRLEEVREAGPLFPARTDGEPVPDPRVLELLEALATDAPAEIVDELAVLVEEARVLVAEAQDRRAGTSTSATTDRWSRSVVEQAQRAAFDYARSTCDIDLTRATALGTEADVEVPPPVLPTD